MIEAYLTAKADGKLAGIVFGWPRKIVDPNHQRNIKYAQSRAFALRRLFAM